MNDLYIIYRISDKSLPKHKLPNAGKKECLLNTIKEFGKDCLYILADNCSQETLNWLYSLNIPIEETHNGNGGTCYYIFDKLIHKYNKDDYLYLLEDDYLHLPNSKQILLEGLQIADYVTLYDHPDMYKTHSPNFLVHDGLPKCSIFLTQSRHWRETISTTMTFAAKVQTLIEDSEIWKHFSANPIPCDFYAFCNITRPDSLDEAKRLITLGITEFAEILINNYFNNGIKRLLISPIPGLSTHTDLHEDNLSPLIDWTKI